MKAQPAPDTEAFASHMRTHQEWTNHSAKIETERNEARAMIDKIKATLTRALDDISKNND